MGLQQLIYGRLTCPVCGEVADTEIDLTAPWPDPDAPLELKAGDGLAPFQVSAYDESLTQLRSRPDPEAGRVLCEWWCPRCSTDRWALVSLGRSDGNASVISLEARPMAVSTFKEADWAHPGMLRSLVHDLVLPPHTQHLDEVQRSRLERVIEGRGAKDE